MTLSGIIGLVVWVVCLVANINIANKRNKSTAKWVILSIFFSWIALIINYCCAGPNGEK